jgi:mono/diheme cytochrome c family protein
MRRSAAVLALILAALGAGACRRGVHQPPAEPLEKAFRSPDRSAIEDRGRRLFLERCATCHGERGHADGQNAFNLDPPPPDFAQSLGARPEAERRLIIEKGSAAAGRSALCPPFGRVLDSEAVDALLAYLRVLEHSKDPVRRSRLSGGR